MAKKSKSKKDVILVTGGAGFMGSTFVNTYALRYPDTKVVVVDALTSVADKRNIAVLKEPNVSFVRADIRNKRTIDNIFKKFQPTMVAHFAAETHVDVSILNPQLFLETNIIGTHTIAAASLAHGVRRFLHISTDEVYGALGTRDPAFTEESQIRPNSPYSASKAGAEHVVRAFQETYGLDTVIARSSNNYGPRQDATKLIPLFTTRLLKGEDVPLYGKGLTVRDWIYVDDAVNAFITILEKGVSGQVYNVGSRTELRNIDIVRILLKLTGENTSKISYVQDRRGHDFRYALDTKKIIKLGWKPLIPFEDGIRRTVEYYRTRPLKR